MKLIRVVVGTQFRSLSPGFEVMFNDPISNGPICLVGANGSGKSNLLEAIAEMFSYLNTPFLNFVKHYTDSPIINAFELEYFLPKYYAASAISSNLLPQGVDNNVHIKIIKEDDLPAEYYLINNGNQVPLEKSVNLLPQRIVGYSSGQNEILSLPFRKILFKYFHNLKQENNKASEDSYDPDDETNRAFSTHVDYGRLHYLSYEDSSLLILSNLLSANLNIIDDNLGDINSPKVVYFELIVKKLLENDRGVALTSEARRFLSFLYSTATEISEAKYSSTLRFVVTDSIRSGFVEQYLGPSGLFNAFYNLSLINLNGIKESKMRKLLRGDESDYLSYRRSDFEAEDVFFKVSRLEVARNNTESPISYKYLSDGEHQFLHILSAISIFNDDEVLFLLDEPETHFNPKWKYQYFRLLENAGPLKKSQILLTTHDPVLISGLSKGNVIVFRKPGVDAERTYKPMKDLKGMGIDAILMSDIFEFDTAVDYNTKQELIELRNLQLKRLAGADMTIDEQRRLNDLYENLKEIDFAKPLNDPMYRDFLLAKGALGEYSRPFLSEEEESDRRVIAEQIMKEIKKKLAK